MFIPITPVPKPRTTQRDRWAKRPVVVRYYAFCDELRLKFKEPLPERLGLIFYIKTPQSWSKKKTEAMLHQPHQQRPDIDNLTKAVMDALCEDDSHIYQLEAKKVWNDVEGIEIYEIR